MKSKHEKRMDLIEKKIDLVEEKLDLVLKVSEYINGRISRLESKFDLILEEMKFTIDMNMTRLKQVTNAANELQINDTEKNVTDIF